MSPNDLNQLAIDTIRGLSMDAVQAAKSGHPGTPMALAPLGWVIFDRLRKHDPSAPEWADRDRFVLSCGHASMLQYSLLHLSGYDLSLDDLKQFRQWGSRTPGHPEAFHTPGVEVTTGPLGQGIGMAVGMAMAERHLAARFNEPGHAIIDHRVWVIASDGDVMEGVAAEAASLAGHLGLGKLTVFWDDNDITIDGRTSIAFTEDVCARFAACGWHTASVMDGNDLDAIEAASHEAMADPRPSLIRVKTIIGYPSPGKQDTSSAHGSPLGAEEIARTKEVMGWPAEPFHVPEAMVGVRARSLARGEAAHAEWEARLSAYAEAFPEKAEALAETLEGNVPADWDAELPRFEVGSAAIATRKASGKVLAAMAKTLPNLVGGSADLAGSNLTTMVGEAYFHAEAQGVPRNVHWGIREHAMGAAINGMALHGGLIPFGATFLVFSDYMRPALRLAALQGLRTRYVYTHDSIGLGEDGPTHQPIEHLAALRAIPEFAVFRPADANETRQAWISAMVHEGPAALVLTRQGLPVLDPERTEGARRGAYILAEAEGGAPDSLLLATGSEVHIALEAQALLAMEGIRARVVSMPCWELFEAQEASYRDEILPPTLRVRVAIEAGIRQGWDRWVGSEGAFITLDRFGASAPFETLYEKLGITAERAALETRRLLAR